MKLGGTRTKELEHPIVLIVIVALMVRPNLKNHKVINPRANKRALCQRESSNRLYQLWKAK